MFWLTTGQCFGRTLGISPCRTQFVKNEFFTLYCRADERIMANPESPSCSQKTHECTITMAKEHHSGSYWCESNSGEGGDAVNITVTGMCVSLCHQLVLSVQYSPFRTLHYGRLSGMCLVSSVQQLLNMSIVVAMITTYSWLPFKLQYISVFLIKVRLFTFHFTFPVHMTKVYAHTRIHTDTQTHTDPHTHLNYPKKKRKKEVTLFSTRY